MGSIHKTFFFVTFEWAEKARMFVPEQNFTVWFVSKQKLAQIKHFSDTPLLVRLLALPQTLGLAAKACQE
jgi:hypothetical protein